MKYHGSGILEKNWNKKLKTETDHKKYSKIKQKNNMKTWLTKHPSRLAEDSLEMDLKKQTSPYQNHQTQHEVQDRQTKKSFEETSNGTSRHKKNKN